MKSKKDSSPPSGLFVAPVMVLVGWLGALPCLGQSETESLIDQERQANVAAFDQVWETIQERYWDPERLESLGWADLRDELRPQVEQAESTSQARGAIEKLIQALGQSHFGIVPASAYGELQADGSDGQGAPGFEVIVREDRVLILNLDPEGPAAKAGLGNGFEILAIEGKPVSEAMSKVRKLLTEQKRTSYLPLTQSQAIVSRLGGEEGETRSIQVRDGEGAVRDVELTLATPEGKPSTFGELPTLYVRSTLYRMALEGSLEPQDEGDIGYYRLNVFFDPIRILPEFRKFVRSLEGAAGLIIDLRGNPGGIGAMAMGIGGMLVQEQGTKLGTMTTRDGSLDFILLPQSRTFTGPVAVLIDGRSASTSEILAAGLQDLSRARVFGTPTPGACLPSAFTKLPNDDRFQFAFANYVSVDGEELEGQGVQPDQMIDRTREDLLSSRDPTLEAAREWIAEQASSTQSSNSP